MAHGQRKKKDQVRGKEIRYRVRGVRREPVDIAKLSKALIGLGAVKKLLPHS